MSVSKVANFIEIEVIEQYRKSKSSYLYFLKEQTKLKENKSRDLFSGCSNMFGGLSDDRKKQILSYINNPTEKQWDELYSVIICSFRTLWQAWISVDFNAPRTKDGENWSTFPDGKTLTKAIREMIGDTDEKLDNKVVQFKKEYLLLEYEYPALKTNSLAQKDYLDDVVNPKLKNKEIPKNNVVNLTKR